MGIVRYRPLSLLGGLQSEINNLFGQQGFDDADLSSSVVGEWSPAVDIKEEKDRFVLLADIPGVDPKEIEIHMENGVLTLKGEKTTESKKEEKGYTRVERFSGSFYRRFALPDTADGDSITAKTKHGVLEIVIPKASKETPKKIEVKIEE